MAFFSVCVLTSLVVGDFYRVVIGFVMFLVRGSRIFFWRLC